MGGILSIATSGLNSFQRALDVTGHNIANVGNSSYSRQVVIFSQLPSQRYAGSFIGSGVIISDIKRNSDRFATQQVRDTFSVKTQYDTFLAQAAQVDKLLSQDGTSISATLQNFFNSISQLNDSPDNIAARGVVLRQSELLAEQFNTMQLRLDEYQRNNSAQLEEIVTNVNEITKKIAAVNQQLTSRPEAPDLLDKRDELLRDLSKYMDVNVIPQGDSSISVSVGNGEMLVIGTEQRDLAVNASSTGQFGTQIVIGNGAGFIDITDNMHSGMIGGLLDFENKVITPASQLLGQMAIGLASQFNTQHRLGMDMNNLIGKDYFTDYNQTLFQLNRAIPQSNNAGTGVLSVQISDMSQIKTSDYEMIVTDTGTNEITLRRKSDGQMTTLNWTSSPPAPPAGAVTIDGMTITVDNIANLVNNDNYTISPTRGAARDLRLALSDPRELAFASPVRVESSLANAGSGQIKRGQVFDTVNVNKEYRIDFISPTQYNLVNVTDSVTTGPFVFTPNTDNTVMIPDSLTPSYSIVLSGLPETGDQFTATYNAGGFGDSANGVLLSDVQKNKMFELGSETLFDRYSGLIASVGSKTYQARINSETADMLHKQAVDFRDSESGVNLDEEAANILRFQQAYQATGQLLTVASQLIDVLFAAMR